MNQVWFFTVLLPHPDFFVLFLPTVILCSASLLLLILWSKIFYKMQKFNLPILFPKPIRLAKICTYVKNRGGVQSYRLLQQATGQKSRTNLCRSALIHFVSKSTFLRNCKEIKDNTHCNCKPNRIKQYNYCLQLPNASDRAILNQLRNIDIDNSNAQVMKTQEAFRFLFFGVK